MDAKQFGKLLKDIRHEHLSREEIAKRYNRHPNTIKNYENKGRMADIEYLALLAVVTGYNFLDLITKRLLVAQHAEKLPADIDVNKVCEAPPGYSLGGVHGNVRQFSIHNDTMSPTIKSDGVVIYDVNQKELKDGKMFVLSFDGEYQVRRVQISMQGTIKLICDNKSYAPETLAKGEVKKLNIVGMVTSVTNFF